MKPTYVYEIEKDDYEQYGHCLIRACINKNGINIIMHRGFRKDLGEEDALKVSNMLADLIIETVLKNQRKNEAHQ